MSAPTENDRVRIFTRRALLAGGLKLGVFALIAGRLYQLQVREAAKYQTLAEENRINQRLIPPPRGRILDRFGVPVAVNQQNFRLVIDPRETGDAEELLDRLAQFLSIDDSVRHRILRDLGQRRPAGGALVQDNLDWNQVAAIELHRPQLGGARIEPGEVRSYPYGAATAHILGYVGVPGERDVADTPLLAIPGFRIGKNGVEQQEDELLRGQVGNRQMEVDAHGRIVRELAYETPQPGDDLTLNIDIGLQQFVQQRLSREQSAAAIIMDVHSGAVYALASHPGFDPNLFTLGIGQSDWNNLNNDPRAPLSNKAVSGLYAPGSVFKLMTALAGLEAGTTDESRMVYCPGHFEVGNHRFHCWKQGGHGAVDMVKALAASCDTYFYDLAQRTGIDRIQAMALRFGLGARTGIDLPHERGGLIPSRDWKRANLKQPWQAGETVINGIGQGYVLTTPLQLAVMAARIANGGYAVQPQLVKRDAGEDAPPIRIAAQHLAVVKKGMETVVNSVAGTAFAERIKESGLAMAGKTGTSQVRRISKAERAEGVIKNEQLPWEQRDHALFAGYAPLDRPQYAAAIVVEHGGSGAHVAAPIIRDILRECQKRNPARG